MAITTFKQKQQHLDSLISSQEDLKSRNCLTQKGIDYLDGLKSARKLVFGEPDSVKSRRHKIMPTLVDLETGKLKKNGKGKITKKR